MSSDVTTSGQRPFYLGINLHDICYGVQLYLCFKTMRIYLDPKRRRRKSDRVYVIFTIVMFIVVTIWMSLIGTTGQEEWVQNQHLSDVPVSTTELERRDVAITAFLVIQLMTDGLMMYRCRIVWDSSGIIIIPFIMWLATLGLGILLIWAISVTWSDIFIGIAAKFGLAYFTISVLLTATLTCMICYRLVRHARTVETYLGEGHAAPYFTIVTLLVESVLPLTLVGIAFLVSYGLASPVEDALSQFYTAMMAVSPQMLILRVAQGIAWEKDLTRPPLSTLEFSDGHADTTMLDKLDRSETVP